MGVAGGLRGAMGSGGGGPPLARRQAVTGWSFVLLWSAVLLGGGSVAVNGQSTNISTDTQALLAFKDGILSDPLKILNGWGVIPDVCNWGGVSCSEGRVSTLDLTNLKIVGLMGASLGDLDQLEGLLLKGNTLAGRFPESFGRLTKLADLDVTGNGLIGTIPVALSNLTKLQYLDLSANELSGPIPDSLGTLTRLKYLNLSANALAGPLPESLFNLTRLETLDLSDNSLTGPLSASVGRLTGLIQLALTTNELSGEIPGEVGNLTALKLLELGRNNFSGSIPKELGKLTGSFIVAIDLRQNMLTGPIPEDLFVPCNTLLGIALLNNRLTGPLPRTLENCRELVVLRVEFNQLSGNLSSQVDWSNLPFLFEIRAQNNSFSGPVPESLGSAPSLGNIQFTNNSLTGPIPASLGKLQELRTLELSLNPLNTSIPANLSYCANLTTLLLSNAQLHGSIPPDFTFLQNLARLDLSDNRLSGEIPMDLALCCQQTIIDGAGLSLRLQNNNLTGSIPELLVNGTVGLVDLWLFNNSLSGSLPQTFGLPGVDNPDYGTYELPESAQMRDVRLQNNQLSGPLPPSISQAVNLEYFYVGGNAFNGSIPPNLFNSSVIEVDLSDNELSGYLPSLGLDLPGLQLVNMSSNQLTGGVPSDFFQYPSLQLLDLSGNELTGPVTIPTGGSLNTSIDFLDLSRNQINGSLPPEIGGLGSLSELHLAGNKLSGSLPAELGSCAELRLLELSNNSLTGGIPSTLSQLPFLVGLFLDGNSLSGAIPPALGNISNLLHLKLDRNSLTGPIPAEIGNLTFLQTLDLSSNALNGSIPGALSGLASLNFQELNFSSNLLQGAIPAGNLSLAASTSFANNTDLCGAPLPECPSPGFQLSGGAIAGIVIGCLCFLAILGLLIAYLIIRQRRFGPDGGELVLYVKLSVPLTYKELLAATGNWGDSQLLGVGGFGSVYKALLPDGETLVAIKRLNQGSSQGINELRTEVRTLGSLRHRNLVTLIGSYISEKECLLIYELLPGGDLDSYLFGDKKVFKDWAVRHNVLLGSAKGFKYLHHDTKPTVIHRDIKPPNILLDDEMEPHVADFGLAKEIDLEEQDHLSTAVSGTVGYLAPEYAQSGRLTTKSDVFAFGVVLLQVMTGKRPTDKTIGDAGLARWVSQLWMKKAALDAIDPKMEIVDSEIGQLLGALKLGLMCTSRNADDRPTMAEVVHLLEHLDMFDSKLMGGESPKA